MESGVEVWLKDATRGWVPGAVFSKTPQGDGKVCIKVLENNKPKLANGDDDVVIFIVDDELADMNDLKLKNSEAEGYVENLIKLPYLHEPAILHCLEQRYFKGDIYTYTGPILIAVNPFKKLDIYTSKNLEIYHNHGLMKSQNMENASVLPPHVYAIADAAFREMMKVIMNNYGANANVSANQAILISGESGAGKTESTKHVLKYLTTVGNPNAGAGLLSSNDSATGTVMDKILQSNPILEAFGNARTLRNDNSSRFGKYIDLNFSKRGHLIGGTIRTYLLEKVRLPTQQAGERNFHIFYQLFKGGSPEELADWELTQLPDFFYTSQGGIYDLKHIDDAVEFQHMKTAFNTLNFEPADQKALLQVLSGLLHVGQLQFETDASGEGCQLKAGGDFRYHAEVASRLCGVDANQLVRILTSRNIITRNESYEKKLTPAQASDARDAFAKSIYGKIFDWIVVMINKSIVVDQKQIRADIGVLDIFGFECFQHNSFEQLCINYTNEALQQQFNQYVFKMEQQEYQNEKINWNFIEFPDNQDCLQLIDHKRDGILAMIDDETKAPGSSDQKLASRMYKSLPSQFPRFSANAKEQRDFKFCVRHYAGPVVYSVVTFVDKNKDELPKEASALLYASTTPLLVKLFNPGDASNIPVSGKTSVPSVGHQFKDQLSKLMEKVYSTTPHYIRCLKPNDQNVADTFHRLRTQEQLRYGGVLEAVRVARSGFPVRLSHSEFFNRYRSLANPFNELTDNLPIALGINAPDKQSHCKELLEVLWDDFVPTSEDAMSPVSPSGKKSKIGRRQSRLVEMSEWTSKFQTAKESVQLGISKVFLRKIAHDVLEARRAKRLFAAARKIEAVARGHRCRRMYKLILLAAVIIQRSYRGYLARRTALQIKRNNVSMKIQAAYRCHVNYIMYNKFKFSVLRLQSRVRGRHDRKMATAMRLERNTIRMQRLMRGMLALRKYTLTKRAIVSFQCRVRVYQAKKELKNLKIAAKDLGTLKQSNEALKAEIEMLKAKAAEETKHKMMALNDKMEAEADEAKKLEKSLRAEIHHLKTELEKEKEISKKLSDDVIAFKEKEKEIRQSRSASIRGSISLSELPADSFRDPSKAGGKVRRPSSNSVYDSPEYKELHDNFINERNEREKLYERYIAIEASLRNAQDDILAQAQAHARAQDIQAQQRSLPVPVASQNPSSPVSSERSNELAAQRQLRKSVVMTSSTNVPHAAPTDNSNNNVNINNSNSNNNGDNNDKEKDTPVEPQKPKIMKRNSITIGGSTIAPRSSFNVGESNNSSSESNSISNGSTKPTTTQPASGGEDNLMSSKQTLSAEVEVKATAPDSVPLSSSSSSSVSSASKLFGSMDDDSNASTNYSRQNESDLHFRHATLEDNSPLTPISDSSSTEPKKTIGTGLVVDLFMQNVTAVTANISKAMSGEEKKPERRPSSSITTSLNPMMLPPPIAAVGNKNKSQLISEKDSKKLRLVQDKLMAGISCKFWEESRRNTEVILRLDSTKRILQINLRTKTFFSKDIPHVVVSTISQCVSGSDIKGDFDDNCLFTLVCQEGAIKRVIAILVSNKEDRNIIVDGLKLMKSDSDRPVGFSDVVALALQRDHTATASSSESFLGSSLSSSLSSLTSSLSGSSDGSSSVSSEEVNKLKQDKARLEKELKEKNDEYNKLQKRETALLQELKSKDDVLSQERDTSFRMGKKVESLYFDISEKMEEIEDLLSRINVLEQSLQAASS